VSAAQCFVSLDDILCKADFAAGVQLCAGCALHTEHAETAVDSVQHTEALCMREDEMARCLPSFVVLGSSPRACSQGSQKHKITASIIRDLHLPTLALTLPPLHAELKRKYSTTELQQCSSLQSPLHPISGGALANSPYKKYAVH
jgi:hypothetical protein